MSSPLFDFVKVCTSCGRRAEDGRVAELSERLLPLLKRELEKDGLSGMVRASGRPCFGVCPNNGILVGLGDQSTLMPAERHVVRSLHDLDFIYARLMGEI